MGRLKSPGGLIRTIRMPKQLIKIEMERDSLSQKWGITIQGGADLSLTAKVASVKRFSPADRAGLEKMDYVWTVNGKEVFQMSQPDITNAILNSRTTSPLVEDLELRSTSTTTQLRSTLMTQS